MPAKTKAKSHLIDKRANALLADGVGDDDELLTAKETAAWLKVSEKWLEIGRAGNFGPASIRLAPKMVRYRKGTIRAWLKSRAESVA